MDKCAIFIDGGYFSKILKKKFNSPKIDYLKFSNNISKGYDRIRTYYYNCMPYKGSPPTDDEKERFDSMNIFIEELKKLPNFGIRLGKLKKRSDKYGNVHFVQKRVDILLAVDLIRLGLKGRIDCAILVTGDNDFVPAIELLQDEGIVVHLYCTYDRLSQELYNTCDERFEITKELIDASKQ